MRIAVAATPAVALPTLNFLQSSEDELALIITQPDKPAGRGLKVLDTPVALWGYEHGVEVCKPSGAGEIIDILDGIDLLITIGYGLLLPKSVLDLPQKGCLNLHFSLLPRWRGAAPVQRAIEAGDPVSGVTVFQLDEGMDTGPIYSIKRFALDSDITSDELFHELSELGVEAIQESLSMIKAGSRPTPQAESGATRAFKLSKSEGEIDWSKSAQEISQKIRAFTSKPGAWTTFRGSLIKVETPSQTQIYLNPGEIRTIEKKMYVGTGTTALQISYLTPAGKNRMESAAWVHGIRLNSGETFG